MDVQKWVCKVCGDNCELTKLENVQIESPPNECPWGLRPAWIDISHQANPADGKPVCAFDNGDGVLRCSITGNPIGTDTVSRR